MNRKIKTNNQFSPALLISVIESGNYKLSTHFEQHFQSLLAAVSFVAILFHENLFLVFPPVFSLALLKKFWFTAVAE